jgi:hypothetical protein
MVKNPHYRVKLVYPSEGGPKPSKIRITIHGTGPGGSPGVNIDKCLENKLQGRVLNGSAC